MYRLDEEYITTVVTSNEETVPVVVVSCESVPVALPAPARAPMMTPARTQAVLSDWDPHTSSPISESIKKDALILADAVKRGENWRLLSTRKLACATVVYAGQVLISFNNDEDARNAYIGALERVVSSPGWEGGEICTMGDRVVTTIPVENIFHTP